MKKIEGYKLTKPDCCLTCEYSKSWHDGCIDCSTTAAFFANGKAYHEPVDYLGWCPKYERTVMK